MRGSEEKGVCMGGSKFQMPNAKFQKPNSKCQMPNAECQIVVRTGDEVGLYKGE
jgi:hypothetical protein